jgi:hypothetical protein
VAVWLQTHWPLWRNVFDMEGQIVAQSEFTVAETISGKAFMTGCLMGPDSRPIPPGRRELRPPTNTPSKGWCICRNQTEGDL